MKKLVVLILFMFMASLASATITFEYTSDSAGTLTITEIVTGGTFYLVVSGLVSDMAIDVKLYDAYENVGLGSDYADFTGTGTFVDNGQGNPAAGNASGLLYSAQYDGWDAGAFQLANEDATDDGVDGQWFILELLAGGVEHDDWTVNLYESDYWTPTGVTTGGIDIVPEPMTLALLGLGGLFLRRRRA